MLKLRRPSFHISDSKQKASDNIPAKSATPQSTSVDNFYGRTKPPPPHGSGYSEFLNWASDESISPNEEDTLLATKLWMGLEIDEEEYKTNFKM